jgi:N-acetylmuramoyl-L-alanine amidase
MPLGRALRGAPLVAAAFACARSGSTPSGSPSPTPGGALPAAARNHLPEVPLIRGPLALRVTYPAPGSTVEAGDSTFLLGSTGAGDAELTINGARVQVWPSGGWIAWVGLPPDSLMRLELRARTPRDTAALVHEVRRRPAFVPPPGASVWIDTTSLSPRGRVWAAPGEYMVLSARAAPGVALQLRLPASGTIPLAMQRPDEAVVPFTADPAPERISDAVRAFESDTLALSVPVRDDRYRALLRGRAVGPGPGPVLPEAGPGFAEALAAARTRCAPGAPCAFAAAVPDIMPSLPQLPLLEAIRGSDTVRVVWPLQVGVLDTIPTVAALDDDPRRAGGTDSITVGRAAPGATYNWFFPTGTRALATGRINDDLRLQLAPGHDVWVPAAEARAMAYGTPPPKGRVEAITLQPAADRVLVRVPLGERVPFRVEEGERRLSLVLYGAEGDVDWIRYGPVDRDSLVQRLDWRQDAGQVVRVDVELTRPVWGYRTRWKGTDLILEIRRPPRIDQGDALDGRVIAIDAGHPPAGATGPTGLREAEANLAVSRALARLLEAAGARVILTRSEDVPVDLARRIPIADSLGAELLVSIHQNALPDGLNPFTNHGTSVFYNLPRSLPLARAIQRRLVEQFGVRDLGVARGDLAVTRATWMPAVLTEGLHIIMPEHEAALRSQKGQELYARGVFEGIRDYLRAASDER